MIFDGNAARGYARAVADVDALASGCRLAGPAFENAVVFKQQAPGARYDDRVVAISAADVRIPPEVDIEDGTARSFETHCIAARVRRCDRAVDIDRERLVAAGSGA